MADPEINNHNSDENVDDNVYVTTMDRPEHVAYQNHWRAGDSPIPSQITPVLLPQTLD
ncbi:hypothetical protein HanLR1_Chr11g0394991 [Helianthus annuus]|nr:hypothetical protein HanHA89_Chr11g0417601 [Helianthus annuus]KAJ0684781.1 hypothetical protein HanLR1_Chr11g0394991 [Helianthus annuus]